MATSSSTSSKVAAAPPEMRAVDSPALNAQSDRKANARPTPAERIAAMARSGTPDRAAPPTPAKEAAKRALGTVAGSRATPSGSSATPSQQQTSTRTLKSPHKLLIKPSQPSAPPQAVAAPQAQSRATAVPSAPTARTKISPAPRQGAAGDREAVSKETVQSKKDPERDTSPKKRFEEDREHPYTQGRLSTMKALRHVAVHLATGFVGGYLLNGKLDKKVARKESAPPSGQGANRQEGARRAADTRTDMSPRQQQQARISRATAQAAASPATNSATNRQSSARRAADRQAQVIGRPEQQVRIKRASLQAAPVKAKGRGR